MQEVINSLRRALQTIAKAQGMKPEDIAIQAQMSSDTVRYFFEPGKPDRSRNRKKGRGEEPLLETPVKIADALGYKIGLVEAHSVEGMENTVQLSDIKSLDQLSQANSSVRTGHPVDANRTANDDKGAHEEAAAVPQSVDQLPLDLIVSVVDRLSHAFLFLAGDLERFRDEIHTIVDGRMHPTLPEPERQRPSRR